MKIYLGVRFFLKLWYATTFLDALKGNLTDAILKVDFWPTAYFTFVASSSAVCILKKKMTFITFTIDAHKIQNVRYFFNFFFIFQCA